MKAIPSKNINCFQYTIKSNTDVTSIHILVYVLKKTVVEITKHLEKYGRKKAAPYSKTKKIVYVDK